MVVEAERLGCVREVLVIAAALSIQDPRERPLDKQAAGAADARPVRRPDVGPAGLAEPVAAPAGAAEGLVQQRFPADVQEGVPQLPEGAGVAGPAQPAVAASSASDSSSSGDVVTQALLAGLLSHVGLKQEREYLGARGARFAIAPGSALFKKPPHLVVAAELVETTRLWARRCRADRAGVGRGGRRAPAEADLQRAALVEEAGLGRRLRAGHSLRHPDRHAAGRAVRLDRPGRVARPVHPVRRWSRGTGTPTTRSGLATAPCSPMSRSSSTAPAGATSSSTRRRSSRSTTRGCPADVVSGAHFDAWWKPLRDASLGPHARGPGPRRRGSRRAPGRVGVGGPAPAPLL